ncbi:required for drug-induced death protein 1-like [Diretmus argenteus]
MKPRALASRLFDRNAETSGETRRSVRAAKYDRQVDCVDRQVDCVDRQVDCVDRPVDCVDRQGSSARTGSQEVEDSAGPREKCQREIHFAFHPERYEPLVESNEAQLRAKEERKQKKKEKYKKVKKNVGKALHSSWKCLMLGLYNFALGYSTPVTAAATFIPEFHPGRARG